MPTYTYKCDKCNSKFELFSSIANYIEHPSCPSCAMQRTARSYEDDLIGLACSVKKHSSELKTIGDLANRNRDLLSGDEKISLYEKHNSYKDKNEPLNLPKGMSEIKKPKTKTKWTSNG